MLFSFSLSAPLHPYSYSKVPPDCLLQPNNLKVSGIKLQEGKTSWKFLFKEKEEWKITACLIVPCGSHRPFMANRQTAGRGLSTAQLTGKKWLNIITNLQLIWSPLKERCMFVGIEDLSFV